MSTNLLEETKEVLESNDKSPDDVQYIGGQGGKNGDAYGKLTWSDFVQLADFEYYSGHGGQKIASDLVVVGKDWWLERDEYDGAECWSYKERPEVGDPDDSVESLHVLDRLGWQRLEEINVD